MNSTNYSNASVNSFSEYNQLGSPNPLIASPPLQIYPSMSFQYKNVTDGKINLGYTALAHGPYSSTGYGVYNNAYPDACSSYYIVKCPTDERIQQLTVAAPSPSPNHQGNGSGPTISPDVLQTLHQLQIRVYIDPSHSVCQAFMNYVHSIHAQSAFVFMDISQPNIRAEMMSRSGGNLTLPLFFSATTGNTYAGAPPSLPHLIQLLQQGDGAISSSMAKESFQYDEKKKRT